MTRQEFDQLPSNGKLPCPDCGLKATTPYPGCGCPPNSTGYGTMHINRFHHECADAMKRATRTELRRSETSDDYKRDERNWVKGKEVDLERSRGFVPRDEQPAPAQPSAGPAAHEIVESRRKEALATATMVFDSPAKAATEAAMREHVTKVNRWCDSLERDIAGAIAAAVEAERTRLWAERKREVLLEQPEESFKREYLNQTTTEPPADSAREAVSEAGLGFHTKDADGDHTGLNWPDECPGCVIDRLRTRLSAAAQREAATWALFILDGNGLDPIRKDWDTFNVRGKEFSADDAHSFVNWLRARARDAEAKLSAAEAERYAAASQAYADRIGIISANERITTLESQLAAVWGLDTLWAEHLKGCPVTARGEWCDKCSTLFNCRNALQAAIAPPPSGEPST